MRELSSSQGILFFRKVNVELCYHENGNEGKNSKYVGAIENGLPNGNETCTNFHGFKYVVEIKDGGRPGKGTYKWYDGSKYEGEFKDEKNGTEIKQTNKEKSLLNG